ncbi:DNA-binding HxlR family transcriptional regulator [Rhodococcus sp. 27YEA15]|uniref:winged helix-turn-helix transcriptional regulator n=1 Tax=Rhodococcus sp. 27YEA15 TaxID=3156259 RepID=UPI003C7BC994
MSPDRNTYGDLFAVDCRLRDSIQVFAHKWDPLILAELTEGPVRREVLRRLLSISDKSLTESLTRLLGRGLIVRIEIPSAPLRVDYALSGQGRSFVDGPLRALADWTTATQ